MKRLVYIFVGLLVVLSIYILLPSEEYYIPKTKAKIKIELPSEVTTVFKDDIITFSYYVCLV